MNTLSELKGKRAEIFREVQSRALAKFSVQDIQMLVWSLQSGLKYEELTKESRKIIDEVVSPTSINELRRSLLEEIERKWDKGSLSSNFEEKRNSNSGNSATEFKPRKPTNSN